ncbi:MOSC domain-containing protein [Thalassobaculum sp. OXR-137]|uniref:MOSC domain-containing protein n=1 Tax=Thalassobaculum sp. OXR-137 TaxID=3100173 RepID=UPI002AC8E54A|nr:MOSC domain-containing protein [Thalassobaculum sp. OXR-137]WPZ36313.1 MOSC domain-containing protein [Thalassobaculum sp. OXR-137]
MNARVTSIHRFPVKGLSAQTLDSVELSVDRLIPFDRRFAIAHGSAPVNPAAPDWLSKAHFLQVMSVPKLAALETLFDDATATLEIRRNGRSIAHGELTSRTGCTVIEQFFAAYAKNDLRGAPKIVDLGERGYTDVDAPFLSIINLASVRDLERVVGKPVDPMRFRGNLLVDGLEPWEEMGWVGRSLTVGGATVLVEEITGRCAATNADPATGQRDLTIPHDLQRGFGHTQCGIYVRVTGAGRVSTGDAVRLG